MSFTDLLDFQTDFGIPEEDWLSKADDEEKARLVEPPECKHCYSNESRITV
jgi:hypothetical protein